MTSSQEMNDGVEIILKRMETHPEEFYGESQKWAFIYKEYFRDIMTETERAAIHTKLKSIRRAELTNKVMETITAEEDARNEQRDEVQRIMERQFGSAPIKREGATITYNDATGTWK